MEPKYEDMKAHDLFATPSNISALHDYLGSFSGSEAVIATTCAMMMYNYLVTNYHLTKK